MTAMLTFPYNQKLKKQYKVLIINSIYLLMEFAPKKIMILKKLR
jgi:hypothetical protein